MHRVFQVPRLTEDNATQGTYLLSSSNPKIHHPKTIVACLLYVQVDWLAIHHGFDLDRLRALAGGAIVLPYK